jgi:outer membrane protein assembly factor BamB
MESNCRTRSLTVGEFTAVALLGFVSCCEGADWPQFRGPTHDGVSTDHLNTQWSGAVTNPVWLVPVTSSLCSFSVSGGRAFTQVNRSINSADKEVCVALNISNGAELWATPVDDAVYPEGGVGYDDGPRSTPVIDNGSLFVLSSYLNLYRLNPTNGAVIWQKDLLALYGGTIIRYENAASPVIENGLIFLNANAGANTLMALQTSNGALVWRKQIGGLTQSTPVLATIQGVRQLIFAVTNGVVSVAPDTGDLLWQFNYPFQWYVYGPLAVTPVVHQDMVFMSGANAYGYGSVVRRITFTNSVWSTTQLWWTNNPTTHWMTPVAYQGYLYGQFGIQQFDANTTTQLKCIDMATGAVKWSTNNFGHGGTLLVDNHLLIITERGDLVLANPNPNAYTEMGRFLAIPGYNGDNNKCWTAPAVADGRVYVRSTAWGACFDLSVPDTSPVLAVGPASLNFGSLQAGNCTNGTFYVTNLGGGTLSGSVSGAAAPYGLVSGGQL